jgi:hypothetical protein
LNIGFLFPISFELRGQILPTKPKEYDCQFRIRSNTLTGRNQSYYINDNTESLVSSDITEYILPFFNRYNFLVDFYRFKDDLPKSWTDSQPYIGLTLIKNGEIQHGNEIINSFIPTTSATWANEVDQFRQTLIAKVCS